MFVKWVYTGLIEDFESQFNFAKKCIDSITCKYDFFSASYRQGLINALKELYFDEQSKNLVIKTENYEIPIHREILYFRCEKFRDLISFNNDEKKDLNYIEVPQLNKFSYDLVENFIQYLYIDFLDSTIIEKYFGDLKDLMEIFKLNEKNMLEYYIISFQRVHQEYFEKF
ncbi:hypothetical protein M0811_13759 [Anaeramoeba ignava]|uniref:BTB domain-containing protein n=1 Tax=Anaeramoeba ignava TaxID=1746090 RepID=A0A9Q0LVG6_ANAIG|nr:hypothetical protein M0811_13759 [Anaeramoeba ignava]